ncbi:UPF0182 family protein [Thiohalocapsa sp. ML1]|jgi:uncharacterized protein|uniref:UPF0182 family protein n=1 Tax=Thiohalocapsa sp. ML1 TaxID=1431688 RepID=UPI00073244C5|nr:UPF0182 family protein [Thiohalocapsa sp. ML1]
MPGWKRASFIVFGVLLAFVVLAALFGWLLHNFLVELWWFDALGYGDYFWQRLLYRYVVFIAAVVFFFLLFFLNFRLGARFLGARQPHELGVETAQQRRAHRIYHAFQSRSLALYLPLTLALAILVALPLFFRWQDTLLFLFAPEAGSDDPVFGLDLSFYLFSLPIYVLIYAEVVAALVVVLIGLLLLYRLEHRAMPRRGGGTRLRRGARVHLTVVAAALFLLGAFYFLGDAFMLLYTDRHLPLFYGPGYGEMVVTLPLIIAAMLLLLFAGGFLLYRLNTGKGTAALGVTLVALIAVLVLRWTPAVVAAVEEFVVQPNEMTRQAPYMMNNIGATLAAYGLTDVETREYPIRDDAWEEVTPEIAVSLHNIPIWDEDGLLKVYRQLQEIRPYYRFEAVDVGRYEINDVYQQVFLSAREIHLDKLTDPAPTWVNRWLKYTHGYGIVMTPAAQGGAEPTNWFVRGIPPESSPGLEIEEPAIYFGTGEYHPVIAPNASREIDFAANGETYLTDYRGQGGVPIGSLFRKLVFAIYFRDENILYTTQTTAASRLLFRRNIMERINTLTPFLTLAEHPYVVVADGKLYWIQDILTHSDWYPYSKPYDQKVRRFDIPFNYVRNSVKVVVDAYNGTVDYYLVDPTDPIAAAYARIYPGLFKPLSEMPSALQAHMRYSYRLFDVQMDVYARYHQTNPQTFYNQEDAWEMPTVQWRDDIHRITSYYLTLNLLDRDQFDYLLFVPMTPLGQRNMRALAVVGSDGDNYGRIVIYSFPKGTLVYGPAQVDAFIKQDPIVSQELTLWDQRGARADRGRMVVVPIDGVVTYMQGVFLEATAESGMPQLVRVILSQGRIVVMEPSIEEGFRTLNRQIRKRNGEDTGQAVPGPDRLPAVVPAAPE